MRVYRAQPPANLPMSIGRAYFGEEMTALRKRNVKLRTLAMQEQHNAITAETKLAQLERELQTLTGSFETEKGLLTDVDLEKRVQACTSCFKSIIVIPQLTAFCIDLNAIPVCCYRSLLRRRSVEWHMRV